MEIIARDKKETQEFAEKIIGSLETGDVLALYGDLGSGKTTFTSMLVRAMGFSDRVQSPTFVISKVYTKHKSLSKFTTINHIDLYRLRELSEVKELGLHELIESPGSLTIIEWPEIAETLLPKKTIRIFFEMGDEDERKIHVQNLR